MPTEATAQLDDAAFNDVMATLLRVGKSLAEQLELPSATIAVTARATAFEAVARAIRYTILLARHLAQVKESAESRRIQARADIIRGVENAIQRTARPYEMEPLRRELLERIDAQDFDVGLLDRPRADLIAELCQDLGLANRVGLPPHLRRSPDDIAILCAQAAAPAGSGLPQWIATALPKAQANDRSRTTREHERQ